jgi:hypothetical protein
MAHPIILTKTAVLLETLAPNGSTIASWTNANVQFSVNKIGERKRISFTLDSSYPLNNVNIFVNWALFAPLGFIHSFVDVPFINWSFGIPGAFVNGTVYDMFYYISSTLNSEAGKNFKATLTINNGNSLTIALEYYQTYDVNGYINPNADNNHARFLKDKITNPLELTVGSSSSSGANIYNNAAYDGRIYVFAQNSLNPDDKGHAEFKFGAYKAGFYGQGLQGSTPYFVNAAFEYSYNGSVTTGFHNSGYTDVKFKVTSGAAVSKLIVRIIRTDTNNNTVDFLTNYENESKVIEVGMADGKLAGPVTITNSGSTYTFNFRVNNNLLNIAGRYMLIATAYDLSSGVEVDSFGTISVGIIAANPYTGNGIDFDARLSDYNREFSGDDLECVIEERMRSNLFMDFTNDKFKNDIFNRLGLTIPNDIRRYLTQIDFTIYEEYVDTYLGNVRNIFDYRTSTKISAVSYSTGGINLSFNNGYAEFSADWRNRYEGAINCQQTLVNNLNFVPLQSTQDWSGKNLIVEWKLKLFYDDYAAPFTDVLYYKQKINVKGYESIIQITSQIPADEDKTFWCTDDFMCLKATLGDPMLVDYKLINTIEPAPGNILTIEEAESWTGAILPQLSTPKIYNQEEDYGQTSPSVAKFCINTSELLVNSYKISAMAKKFHDGCRRVTEVKDSGGNFTEPRKTEIFQQRVPEECAN